jgi:hypothetical protein
VSERMSEMWTGLWLVLGVSSWLLGFFRAGFAREEGPLFVRSFIRPPFLIYLLCGFPRATNIPKGVIATGSVGSQLLGILLIAYSIVFNYPSNQNIFIHALILFILPSSILLLCWALYKRFPYFVSNAKSEK